MIGKRAGRVEKEDALSYVAGYCIGFDITGRGLLRGLKMRDDPLPLRGKLSDRGLLVGTAGNNTLRLAPPLVVTEDDVREALDIIDQQFASMMTAAGS